MFKESNKMFIVLFQMLALATLDLMMSMDHQQHWLSHMTSKGYLQHIVESFTQDDQQLQIMLQPHPEPLKALYIFESKVVSLSLLYRHLRFVSSDLFSHVTQLSELPDFVLLQLERVKSCCA